MPLRSRSRQRSEPPVSRLQQRLPSRLFWLRAAGGQKLAAFNGQDNIQNYEFGGALYGVRVWLWEQAS